jgi:hypothetical protein
MNRSLFLGVALLALTGCASDEPKSPAQAVLSDTPSWFLHPPSEDGTLYSSGMSVSNDLQFAVDKAVLTAKVSLADRVVSRLDAVAKLHKAEHGTTVTASAEKTAKNIITNADLTGYEVTDCLVTPVGNTYRAYVLVKYVPTKDSDAAKAFEELNRDTGGSPAPPVPPTPETAPKDAPPPLRADPRLGVTQEGL